MTDDLHRSHLPATSTSIPMPTYTSPVTSKLSLHTAQSGESALAGGGDASPSDPAAATAITRVAGGGVRLDTRPMS
jgi:hypothetical protein